MTLRAKKGITHGFKNIPKCPNPECDYDDIKYDHNFAHVMLLICGRTYIRVSTSCHTKSLKRWIHRFPSFAACGNREIVMGNV